MRGTAGFRVSPVLWGVLGVSVRADGGLLPGTELRPRVPRTDWRATQCIFGNPSADQRLLSMLSLIWIIPVWFLAFNRARLLSVGILHVSLPRSKQDVIPPTPADKLAQLLEDEQVENAPCGHFVVVVIRDAVPVQAFQGLGKRHDQGDGERIGVTEDLSSSTKCKIWLSLQGRLTAMAATKFAGRFLKPKHRETDQAQKYETQVWTINMTGIMARSVNFSAVS